MIAASDVTFVGGSGMDGARLKPSALPAVGLVGQLHSDGGAVYHHNGSVWQPLAKASDIEHVGDSEFYVAPAWAKGISNDRFFTSIQSAVNAALESTALAPTVYLMPGVYTQSVVINNNISSGGEKTLHIQGLGRVVWSTPMSVDRCLTLITGSSTLPITLSLADITMSTGPTPFFINNTLLGAITVSIARCSLTSTANVTDAHGLRIEGLCSLRLNDSEISTRSFSAGTGGLSYTAVSPLPLPVYARNCVFRSTNSGNPIRSNAPGNWAAAMLRCYCNVTPAANIVFTVDTPLVNTNV